MNLKPSGPICFLLTIAGLAALLWAPLHAKTPAPQTAFVQGREQTQQSLPPEKKKSLSGFGPDEVFREPNETSPANRRPDARPAARAQASPKPGAQAQPSPSPSPKTTPTALPAAAIAPILTASQPPSGPPAPSAGSPSAQAANASNEWLLPSLGLLTLGVFAALIVVLNRLRQLLSGSA